MSEAKSALVRLIGILIDQYIKQPTPYLLCHYRSLGRIFFFQLSWCKTTFGCRVQCLIWDRTGKDWILDVFRASPQWDKLFVYNIRPRPPPWFLSTSRRTGRTLSGISKGPFAPLALWWPTQIELAVREHVPKGFTLADSLFGFLASFLLWGFSKKL